MLIREFAIITHKTPFAIIRALRYIYKVYKLISLQLYSGIFASLFTLQTYRYKKEKREIKKKKEIKRKRSERKLVRFFPDFSSEKQLI